MNLSVSSLKILLCCCLLVPAAWAEETNLQGNLALDIANVLSNEGTLRIAVYQYTQGADWNAEPFRVAEINPVVAGQIQRYTFTALPFHDYAIRLFHDVNGNKKLDLSESGLPVEPFAISRAEDQKQQSLYMKDAIIHFNLPEQHLLLNLMSIKQN